MALRKTYKSGRFIIISRNKLNEDQLQRIIDIVNQFKYEGFEKVPQTIYHELETEMPSLIGSSIRPTGLRKIGSLILTTRPRKFKIKLFTRKIELFGNTILFV